ncbi:MAG: sodium/proton-translocating pyrophosphatase, partial [Clostridia bacterium]|nr:sodium/proton-translocating pyrophosphatase [Clostridia bacterium]
MEPMNWWLIIGGVIVLAICYVIFNYIRIRKMNEGTPEMVEMAGIIRSGASTFIKTEYKTIGVVVALLAVVLSLFIGKWTGVTFLLGATMSSCVCILGMRSATYANVRTANKARETLSIGQTVKVALCGGSISGLSVQAFGMLGLILILIIWPIDPESVNVTGGGLIPIEAMKANPVIMNITTYALGCSLVAMFNRVAGGNYTKAADISSDILAKIRHDMPEDDSRVPNVVADFIGDNVNDIAGNCSDLLESFVATIAASIMIAVSLFSNRGAEIGSDFFKSMIIFPIIVAGGGLISCLLGLLFAAVKKMGSNPSKELNLATYISSGLTLALGAGASYLMFGRGNFALLDDWKIGWGSPLVSMALGIASGVAIGMITEYYTSADYKPTRKIAEMATEGEAFVVTKGDAVGSRSVLFPVLIIAASLIISGLLCGSYGIAIAALGMLSFVGTTVSIDAFGPIA